MIIDRRLRNVADQQSGYFTARQALDAGYFAQLQNYHVGRGNWQKVDWALYRLKGYADTPESDLIRWSLWAQGKSRRLAVISHQSALHYYGLADAPTEGVHLTLSSPRRRPPPPGCVLHYDPLPTEDYRTCGCFFMTTLRRTLCDLRPDLVMQRRWEGLLRMALTSGALGGSDWELLTGQPLRMGVGSLEQARRERMQASLGMAGIRGGRSLAENGRIPHRSFTLVEMLVVIAVMLILAGLLLPSLNSAYNMARTTICLNNFKQIGVMHTQYINDYRRFATWSARTYAGEMFQRSAWQTILAAEYGGGNALPWICPAIGVKGLGWTSNTDPYSNQWYSGMFFKQTVGINGRYFTYADATRTGRSIGPGRVKAPSALIYAGDNVDYQGVCDPGNPNGSRYCEQGGLWPERGVYFNPCHNYACNLLYLDGHGETVSADILYPRITIWDNMNILRYLEQ